MGILLSRRIRSWLVLVVVLPLVRQIVHRAARARSRKNADARTAELLRRADDSLTEKARRGRRGRQDRSTTSPDS